MLNPDALIERIKLKGQITFWRTCAFVIALIAVGFLFFGIARITIGTTRAPYSDFIARITIDGMIVSDEERNEILEEIAEDRNIKAVIMRVDSGGGTGSGGEQLYEAIKALNAKKPVVAVMGGMATSAAYMISLPTEKIYAQNATLTGSIGVIAEIPNFRDTAKKLGVKFNYIKSSPLKGSPTMFEEKNEEAFSVLQDAVNDFYYWFVKIVAKERNLSEEKAKELADGRVYSAPQALKFKLIDEIGLEKDAVKWLKEEKKLDKSLQVFDVELFRPKNSFEEAFKSIFNFGDFESQIPKTFKGLTL